MGTAPAPVMTFVFDTSRGQDEGQEFEKILYFYPPTTPPNTQKARTQAVVGLTEGLNGFTSLFGKPGTLRSMHSTGKRHIVVEGEKGIWFGVVASTAAVKPSSVADEPIRALLREFYDIFFVLYGKMRDVLDGDPSGNVARAKLLPVMTELTARVQSATQGAHAVDMANSLAPLGMPTVLPLDRDVFITLQLFVDSLVASFAGRAVRHVFVVYQQCLVWSDLSLTDTRRLHAYCTRCLPPGAVAGPEAPRSYSSANPGLEAAAGSAAGGAAQPLRSGDFRLAPDGFYYHGKDRRAFFPVYLEDEGQLTACAFGRDGLVALLLLDGSVVVDSAFRAKIASVIEVRIGRLLSGLQAAVAAIPPNWHIPGFRYLFFDKATKTARASPEGKVATLSADALSAVANLRADTQEEDGLEPSPGADACSYGACVRLAHESWVILRQNPRKCLFTVIERNSYTLVDVMEKFELVCGTHFQNAV